MRITEEQIQEAKKSFDSAGRGHYEHDDCIRIAYEWLDAQKKTKHPRNKPLSLKQLIASWGGRYVSRGDIEIAAILHPEVLGNYPFYNISSRLTEPSTTRLSSIVSAFTQHQREFHSPGDYSIHEKNGDRGN
ncbi:hypothetical protein [Sphaerotilus microaerophilus]|uniref:Uncharacterized protein n=1 Tax=Sphaerotilus microaerophilus TaxID=2914710 RepID=A0ABM7YH55_9BURK|nr:hypothetical protein [Sphaerotilus sp. FB-5]BDI03510.1 hypothetical protein CATMQ487_04800 [Sphaerotilus sp. FB-5]